MGGGWETRIRWGRARRHRVRGSENAIGARERERVRMMSPINNRYRDITLCVSPFDPSSCRQRAMKINWVRFKMWELRFRYPCKGVSILCAISVYFKNYMYIFLNWFFLQHIMVDQWKICEVQLRRELYAEFPQDVVSFLK